MGDFFLIAPFPDHCPLLPFQIRLKMETKIEVSIKTRTVQFINTLVQNNISKKKKKKKKKKNVGYGLTSWAQLFKTSFRELTKLFKLSLLTIYRLQKQIHCNFLLNKSELQSFNKK